MASYQIQYLYSLRDRFTAQAKRLAGAAQKASASTDKMARSAKRNEQSILGAAMAAARNAAALRKMGNSAGYADKRLQKLAMRMRNMRTMQYGMFGGLAGGMGGGIAGHAIVGTLLKYEKAMNIVRANMLDVDKDGNPLLKGTATLAESAKWLAKLRAETNRVAQLSIFSPTEVANGLTELARMGYSAQKSMKLLHPTMRLAGAASVDAGVAVDYATNIMTIFGKDADKATAVVDRLAMAVSNTNLTLPQLYEGLKYAGPSAFAAGIDMDETIAVLMTLAKAGQKASMGGTAFARMMEYGYQKTNKGAQALQAIGMGYDDLVNQKTGKAESMVKVLTKFAEASQKFDKGKVIEAIQRIYKLRGGRAAKVLADFDLIKDIVSNKQILSMSKNRTKMMERIMMSGIYGAFEKLRASLYSLVISLGDTGLSDSLTKIADKLKALSDYITKLPPSTQKLIGNILLFTLAISMALLPLSMIGFAMMGLAPLLMVAGTAIRFLLSPLRMLATGAIWFFIPALLKFMSIAGQGHIVYRFARALTTLRKAFTIAGAIAGLKVIFGGITASIMAATVAVGGLRAALMLIGKSTMVGAALYGAYKLYKHSQSPEGKAMADRANAMSARNSQRWNDWRSGKSNIGDVWSGWEMNTGDGSKPQSAANGAIQSEAKKLRVQTDFTPIHIKAPSAIQLKMDRIGIVGSIPLDASGGQPKGQNMATPQAAKVEGH